MSIRNKLKKRKLKSSSIDSNIFLFLLLYIGRKSTYTKNLPIYIGSFFLYKRKKNIVLGLEFSYLADMLYMVAMLYMSYQDDMYYQDGMFIIYVYNTIPIYLFIYVSCETSICSVL